jgi:hypothetical protein
MPCDYLDYLFWSLFCVSGAVIGYAFYLVLFTA